MSAWTHYLNASRAGKINWYHWLGGFWLIFVGWIIAQVILTSPMMPLLEQTDPELSRQLSEASLAIFEKMAVEKIALFGGVFFLSGLLATGFWVGAGVVKQIKIANALGLIALFSTFIAIFSAVQLGPILSDAESARLMTQAMGLNPLIYISFLITFPGTLAVVFLIQKYWHGRTITSLHTAFERYNWKRTFFAISIFWIIAAIFGAIGHLSGLSPLKVTFDPSRFFGFAIASLLFIPLQSATEEIIVRGYMNQGLGQYIKSPWIVFIITSLFFMALHLGNPEATSSADKGAYMHLLTMSTYFSFGFLLCVLVYYEGGLETAIGVHVANNLFAAIFVNYEGSVLPTPSMFIANINPNYDLPISMAMLGLVTYILVRTRPAAAKSL
ncbi:MAG: CPBP family intramembrane glutamic endopeptidase [Maricaulaceae bacterium]